MNYFAVTQLVSRPGIIRILGLAWRLISAAAAFLIAGLAVLRLRGERRGSAAKRHSQRHHERRDQQRNALAHWVPFFPHRLPPGRLTDVRKVPRADGRLPY